MSGILRLFPSRCWIRRQKKNSQEHEQLITKKKSRQTKLQVSVNFILHKTYKPVGVNKTKINAKYKSQTIIRNYFLT